MRIAYKEAFELKNERQRELNYLNRLPEKYGMICHMDVARFLWPDSSYHVQDQNIRRLKGEIKVINLKILDILAEFLGVDKTFLLFEPSQHDFDYERLCGKEL